MERPHDRNEPVVAGIPDQHAQPVIVRVMTVDDVDALAGHHLAQAPNVAHERERLEPCLEVEAGHEVEAGLARLGLETVARNYAEEHAMAARTEAAGELDDGIGAARPPPVGSKVKDGEAHRARAPATARKRRTRSSTSPAAMSRRHG